MLKLAKIGSMLPLACLLAACEPSADNMREATYKNEKFQFMLALLAGGNPRPGQSPDAAVEEMKRNGVIDKSACSEAQGAPGYICDYRWGQRQANGSVQYGTPVKGRFFKSGDGWNLDIIENRR
jgi:hypothetical protein